MYEHRISRNCITQVMFVVPSDENDYDEDPTHYCFVGDTVQSLLRAAEKGDRDKMYQILLDQKVPVFSAEWIIDNCFCEEPVGNLP